MKRDAAAPTGQIRHHHLLLVINGKNIMKMKIMAMTSQKMIVLLSHNHGENMLISGKEKIIDSNITASRSPYLLW